MPSPHSISVDSSQIRFLADESRPHFSSSSASTLLTDRAMTKCGLTEGDDTAHAPTHAPTQLNGKPRVMVVDDDPSILNVLQSFLSARGYCAVPLADAEEAVKHYASERPAAVMLDIAIGGRLDGLGTLAAFKRIDRDVPVIVVSSRGSTTTIVQAMKLGASDFIRKPFSETDLEVPLSHALKQHQLSRELAALREQLQSQSKRRHLLLGDSQAMADVRDLIDRIAGTDVTVLIRGESGTGKELVARTLFACSLRRDKPFVKVNCAALPTELLESELFGYERGAFTGAIQQKPGKFEFANHGTMFLDELTEMSPALQAKLLQVLQDGEFSRLGGRHDVHVDVRIIAATNRDLERSVANGEFREDLFFRLNVVAIQLPPLRDRREELPVLTEFFPEEIRRSIPQAADADLAGDHVALHGVRLAGECPGAREPDQARRRSRERGGYPPGCHAGPRIDGTPRRATSSAG